MWDEMMLAMAVIVSCPTVMTNKDYDGGDIIWF